MRDFCSVKWPRCFRMSDRIYACSDEIRDRIENRNEISLFLFSFDCSVWERCVFSFPFGLSSLFQFASSRFADCLYHNKNGQSTDGICKRNTHTQAIVKITFTSTFLGELGQKFVTNFLLFASIIYLNSIPTKIEC